MPPRLSTGSVDSFTCAGTRNQAIRIAITARGRVTRNTEPHEKCSSRKPDDQRAERSDRSAERGPQRDRLRPPRPGPERRDQRQRRRIRHARGEPAAQARDEQHDVGRRERGEQGHRDRERRAQDEHQLAAVAVAQSPEPEHRAGEAEGVADGDQVERRLRGIEVLADVRQRDVRDRKVQVGDAGDHDQRREHAPSPIRSYGGAATVRPGPVTRGRCCRSLHQSGKGSHRRSRRISPGQGETVEQAVCRFVMRITGAEYGESPFAGEPPSAVAA